MAFHNRVELLGHLGADPKPIFSTVIKGMALSVATTDSYCIEKDGEKKWFERETVWHDVLIFKPLAVHYANELKKGDRVQITGEISYRAFKDAEGNTRKQATIIAAYIEKVHYEKQEELLPRYGQDVDDALAES